MCVVHGFVERLSVASDFEAADLLFELSQVVHLEHQGREAALGEESLNRLLVELERLMMRTSDPRVRAACLQVMAGIDSAKAAITAEAFLLDTVSRIKAWNSLLYASIRSIEQDSDGRRSSDISEIEKSIKLADAVLAKKGYSLPW